MGLTLPNFPITSKLWPSSRNLMYMAEVAVLTRIATGIMRVMENRPSKQKDPRLSQNEKRQALVERFFVEIIGTAGYMGFLHIGQDLVDKLYSRMITKSIPNIDFSKLTQQNREKLQQVLHDFHLGIERIETLNEHLNQMMKDVYRSPQAKLGKGRETQDMLYRVLYGDDITFTMGNGQKKTFYNAKANLATLKERFKAEFQHLPGFQGQGHKLDEAFGNIVKEVEPIKQFAMKNNTWGSLAILGGVALSAWIGGTFIQKMCDGPVASSTKKWLNNYFPKDSHGADKPAENKETAAAPKPLSLVSEAPPLVPPAHVLSQAPVPPAMAPVYLPNPKQPTATPFAANTLAFPYQTHLMPKPGVTL